MLQSRSCTWQHGHSATTVSAPASTASWRRCPPRTGATGDLADEREDRAAAQPLFAVVLHLDESTPGNRLEHVARRLVDALRATRVAGVVERDAALDRVLELESAVGERRRDELRVVLDLELVLLAALGREVGVELLPHERARRARGHDRLRAALARLGDVVLVDLLEQVPLARRPSSGCRSTPRPRPCSRRRSRRPCSRRTVASAMSVSRRSSRCSPRST